MRNFQILTQCAFLWARLPADGICSISRSSMMERDKSPEEAALRFHGSSSCSQMAEQRHGWDKVLSCVAIRRTAHNSGQPQDTQGKSGLETTWYPWIFAASLTVKAGAPTAVYSADPSLCTREKSAKADPPSLTQHGQRLRPPYSTQL